MLRKFGLAVASMAVIGSTPSVAQTAKDEDCAYQAQVVEAVRQARISRVEERMVADALRASDPTWPEKYNAAIPLVAGWVYEMRMRDVRSQDIASAWKQACLVQ